MKKTLLIFSLVVFCLFIIPYGVSANICNFSPGMEGEALDNCLREQRRLDQQARDQQAADAEYAQGVYQSKINYFYTEDGIEKQFDALNKSDFNYAQYKISSADCRESMRIPSDPTTIDPSIFLSLMVNKERCVDYIAKYVPVAIRTPQQPTKSSDQICKEKFGSNWKWISGTTCGCKDGYTQRNGECISYDQSCNTDYQNSIFLKIDTDGRKICDCKTGYVWNGQKTGCVIAPIVPIKTNDQVCSDAYGTNSNWDGIKTNDGKISCGCKSGYVWNAQRTNCIVAPAVPTKTNDQICQDNYGSNSNWDGTKSNAGGLNCGCKTGYQWNQGKTQCVKIDSIGNTVKKNPSAVVKPSVSNPVISNPAVIASTTTVDTTNTEQAIRIKNTQSQPEAITNKQPSKQSVFKNIKDQVFFPWLFNSVRHWFRK